MENVHIDGIPQISTRGVQPYTIDVAESILTDLGKRLENTRWSPQVSDLGWDGGMDANASTSQMTLVQHSVVGQLF
jgi:hypothetical protein